MRRKFLALLLCFTMIFSFGLTACDSLNIGKANSCAHEFVEETF